MTTYSIREFKARTSEILRGLDAGEEVIITRRGKPCGKLVSVPSESDAKPSLSALRGGLPQLPDAAFEDFLGIKAVWERGVVGPDPAQDAHGGR